MMFKPGSQPIHETARTGRGRPAWPGRRRGASDIPHPAHEASDWHSRPADEVLRRLDAAPAGLTNAEADRRLEHHGPNALPPPPRHGAVVRLLRQFDNVLIYVLLGAGLVTLALGHVVDAGVIVGVVLINGFIGFVQEGKAEQALDAIRQMLSLQAQVLRDGERITVDARHLVPGDIVFVSSGDKVPADLRLLAMRGLRVDEAVLTGESVPVEKHTEPTAAGCALGDRASMAYSGTLVTAGQGSGVVVATGGATEIGRISGMLAGIPELSTPLVRKLAVFGRKLTWIILAGSGVLFIVGLFRGYAAGDMFLAAVGIAVAAIPEGLPAVITITLAVGVRRMAARNAIVRRMPAAEALGAVTVICSDKTGTLTKNEMTVQRVLMADETFDVSGIGYGPEGSFRRHRTDADVAAGDTLREIGRAGILCNDAALQSGDGGWRLAGDPTEGALVTLAMKAGLDPAFERVALPRTDVIPFESEHRFMASLHHDHAGEGFVLLKGAPERVLGLCTLQRGTTGDAPLGGADWAARMEEAASAGMRLLAIATRAEDDHDRELTFAAVEAGGFTLLGVVGISDPPRDEAKRAVAECLAAGIRVKMITGDHVATAVAIGRQLGLAPAIRAISGDALDGMDEAMLRNVAANTDVFARASPEHKLRLVQALQEQGYVVAMTGDGVNDAPALKRADVGIAMGCKGTEAAKEAAEIVLADDNFATIVAAVEEGRTAYDNIRKAILFILPTNGGEAVMIMIAVLLGMTLPVTPVQILWVNMVTAVTLALALGFERTEHGTMRMPPRDPRQSLVSRYLVWRLFLVSGLMVAGSLGLFLFEMRSGASLAMARSAAVNALVAGEIAYLFNCRQLTGSCLSVAGMFGNRYVLAAIALLVALQLLFTYLPAMQAIFGTAGLDLAAWSRIGAFAMLLLLAVEADKWLYRVRSKGT